MLKYFSTDPQHDQHEWYHDSIFFQHFLSSFSANAQDCMLCCLWTFTPSQSSPDRWYQAASSCSASARRHTLFTHHLSRYFIIIWTSSRHIPYWRSGSHAIRAGPFFNCAIQRRSRSPAHCQRIPSLPQHRLVKLYQSPLLKGRYPEGTKQ